MKQYLYETHLHTAPVSKCARADVRQTLTYYKSLGYDGVFITNHFVDCNISCDRSLPYAEKLEFYCSDYEEGIRIGKELGIKVFFGVEMGYGGSDFLIYGLAPTWYFAHPEIQEMGMSEKLRYLAEAGAFIVHAHPFREARYIDHIRLFPRCVHGVETYNASRTDFENDMAADYAKNYELIPFAGSDNHNAEAKTVLGGMQSDTPIADEYDFIAKVKSGEATPFRLDTQAEAAQ